MLRRPHGGRHVTDRKRNGPFAAVGRPSSAVLSDGSVGGNGCALTDRFLQKSCGARRAASAEGLQPGASGPGGAGEFVAKGRFSGRKFLHLHQNPRYKIFGMNTFYRMLVTAAALLGAAGAAAQISVDRIEAPEEEVTFLDSLRSIPVATEYFNRARYRAERAAVRKERNYLEIGGGLQGALTSYNDPWIKVSGGDNSIALIASLHLRHTYTKNLFTVETKFDAKFGYNRMKVETTSTDPDGNTHTVSNGVWFKNQDEFSASVAPSFKMSKNWSYGAIVKFRSQFVNGYVSRTQQEETDRKSTFMAPGYLDVSLGITYKSPQPKFPITVNLSPIAMSAVFVESRDIRANVWDKKPGWQIYGLDDPDRTSKYEGGSSVQIDFDRTFGKTGFLRYRTSLFSFYGWITNIGQDNKIANYSKYLSAMDAWNAGDQNPKTKPFLPVHPTVRWENTLDIKATKFITTTLSFQLYYNRAQNVDVQTQTLLSVGLTYTFKNK